MNSLIVIPVFLTLCLAAHGQQCTTPYGRQGQCISLYNCRPLLEVLNRASAQDRLLLKQSHCGWNEMDQNSPKVCCPQNEPPPPPPPPQCWTPERKPGRCINLFDCPVLADLVKPPVPNEYIQYLQNSRCNGPHQYSVCCGPAPDFTQTQTGNNDHSCMSAFLPDSSSKCCGIDANNGNKIFGGTATNIDQYPWLVLIEYVKNNNVKTLCSGSLISGRYVLTAAHCVVGPVLSSGTPTRIRLGEYDTSVEGQDCTQVEAGGQDCTEGAIRIPIESIIAHTEYNPSFAPRYHDIALIRMTRVAPYSDFIRPICLPKVDITARFPDFNFTTAGWGAISTKHRSSPVKLHVDLPYVTRDRCQPSYGSKVPLWKGQLCAGGEKGKDSCKGDSGGPLMYENGRVYEISGIVSFGHRECGSEGVAAVYTNVYEYDSWIRNNMSP